MFSTGPTPDQVKEPEQQLTFKEKAKNMWKNYGRLAIVTYIGVYGSTLGMMYFALDNGVFNAATFGFDHAAAIAKFCDIVETMTGTTTLPAYIKEHPSVGTFAVGWFLTKFTEPLRLATTIVIVPPIARYWNKLTATKAAEAVVAAEKEAAEKIHKDQK
eukprot:CAMPEP_0184966580 /NCGR_PEP_ID=MMETSP1098-20130426/209_1 /TAXON_ID=89044 /ORGANISM="Spumella elongata, Strain CCAP 955/1" /LENGTH=158 /DNA_ID=CAMNT_0027487875 /DNA_START=67 /DNA_END=543 /DNA_ORIENTATION=+